nr:MAG TPA: hypothetical protein [Caudoviricetes sp.]
MRAMRAPISCFTNKKNSRVEMARLFLFDTSFTVC